jgi:hypothetical protein
VRELLQPGSSVAVDRASSVLGDAVRTGDGIANAIRVGEHLLSLMS